MTGCRLSAACVARPVKRHLAHLRERPRIGRSPERRHDVPRPIQQETRLVVEVDAHPELTRAGADGGFELGDAVLRREQKVGSGALDGLLRVLRVGCESRFQALGCIACSIASPRSRAWTPRTPLTICVMRRSTTRLASDKACRGAKAYSSPISLTISTVAIAAASSRVLLEPDVKQPLLAKRARGSDRRNSGCSWNSITTSMGQLSAGPATSPSPCTACPSPVENSAPSTAIGRNSAVPSVSSRQSRLPPHLVHRFLETDHMRRIPFA